MTFEKNGFKVLTVLYNIMGCAPDYESFAWNYPNQCRGNPCGRPITMGYQITGGHNNGFKGGHKTRPYGWGYYWGV